MLLINRTKKNPYIFFIDLLLLKIKQQETTIHRKFIRYCCYKMNVNRNVCNLTPIHLLYNENCLTVANFPTFNKFAEKERTKPVSLGQTFQFIDRTFNNNNNIVIAAINTTTLKTKRADEGDLACAFASSDMYNGSNHRRAMLFA